MNSPIVITDSPKLTEYEFFRREFQLELTFLDPFCFKLEDFESSRHICIASTRPEKWLEILKLPQKSRVIFFLLGNETYEPATYNLLNNLESVKHVFIYNPPTRVKSINHWYSLAGDLIDQFPIIRFADLIGILRDNRTSRHLKSKFLLSDLSYSWTPLPQGYSNSFVYGLRDLKLLPSGEISPLTDPVYLSHLQNKFQKKRKYIFVGQRTNRRRNQIVEIVGRREDSICITKDIGFGGTNYDGDSRYANLVLSSWFNIIPPGYFNNSNHRYTESCIAGAIPVILHHNSIDHSDNRNWTGGLSILQAHSFRRLTKYLDRLDEKELEELALLIREHDFNSILDTKKLLKEIQSS